ncbi:MAG: transcription termination factor NusA [Oscillospiraceae bacterium]|nr:transcription termination factor NusA [Oscillospiraceae bacterium]
MGKELIDALREITKDKGISEELLFNTIIQALESAYKKNYGGSSQNVSVTLDKETGDFHVYGQYKVVEDENLLDKNTEISLSEAKAINSKYVVDDIVNKEVTPKTFGRVAAQAARQVVVQRIKEEERKLTYNEFAEKEDDIVTGIVLRKEKSSILVKIGSTEAILAPTGQIPGEEYKFNEPIKLYVVEVQNKPKGAYIVISRTHPGFVKRLFEFEVPEIYNGTVEIKSIAREAGSRTKIAVYSKDENVDPMGACVGAKGTRVKNIVDELKNEKIDIIKWSKLPEEYISNALSPATVVDVTLNEDNKSALVLVAPEFLSLAIGKEGQNARLAAKLTGWKIDIKSK